VAYRADIEIAVRGAQELKRLQSEINATSKLVDGLNNYLTNIGSGGITRSINNLRNAVNSAADAFNKAALGTDEATVAATKYVQATDKLNAGLRERSALLDKITRQERAAAMVRAGVGMPAQQLLLPAARQGAPAMGGGARRRITGFVERLGGARTADEAAMALRFAQGLKEQVRPLSQIEALYAGIAGEALKLQGIKALPSSEMLNAAARNLKQLTTNQVDYKKEVQESADRIQELSKQEESRTRRAQKIQQRQEYFTGAGAVPLTGGGVQVTRSSAQAAALAVEEQVYGLRRAQTQVELKSVKDRGFAENYITGIIQRRLAAKGAELTLEQQQTAEIQRQTAEETKQLQLAAAKTRNQRIQNVALGAGFPLLFGGGPGSVLGGAAGGLVPGPGAFAAQIGLSAIGQQADLFVAAVAKTGVALTSTGKTLEFMREKALFSTTAVEDQAVALEEQGKVSELANLLTQDLAKSIGGEGVKALQELGDETNKLTKEWNTLTAQLFALVAGPLSAFIAALNSVLGGITTENRLSTLRKEATPGQQARLAQITREERGGTFRNVPGGGRQFIAGAETTLVRQRILNRAAAEGIDPNAPAGRVTSADVRAMPVPKASDKGARDAAREAQRVLEVLRDQKLITIELERQSDYSKKIFAAELAKDPILARRLQGEQQLEEIAIETAGKLEKEVNMKAKLAILGTQEAKAALAYQKTVQDIALIEQQRKENAENTIRGFQQELALKNATTEAERNRLRIMYEMDALRQGKQFDEGQLAQIEALKKQIAAPQSAAEIVQQRIGALQDEIAKLTNLGTVAVSVADSIGTAFGQAFQGIISGSMTTQEALAGFFKSVGDAFIQMASEIIAKQITMIILQTILKALGGAGGGMGFEGATAQASKLNSSVGFGAGTFTGFKADGGAVKTATPYLVGERGPELFVPGTNGGVMSNSDLRSSMGAAPGSAGGSPVLNMSFETTNIGGTEYVSRDQLEAAMAETRRQATRDGAKRGMTMTLDRIQQSPQTRTRIGLR